MSKPVKILVVYFSYSGNNRLLAEYLAKLISCDICPIIEKRRRTALTIILDMMFRREPKIRPLEYSASNYNEIILVAPIWGSKVANPMKTLVKSEKAALSNYSFISLCGYERSGQKEKITKELSTLSGLPPKAVCELKIGDLFPAAKRNDIKTISRYRATIEDLFKFESQINAFLKLISLGQ
jgi:menaquinone-dependent protoporphyrinogen IX oxidase